MAPFNAQRRPVATFNPSRTRVVAWRLPSVARMAQGVAA